MRGKRRQDVWRSLADKEALTLRELEQLGYGSVSFLYNEANDGRLHITKIGNRSVVLRHDLADWLVRQRKYKTRKKASKVED